MLDVKKFEKKVLSGLKSCGIDFASVSQKSPLGIAVSGGADSVSLLISLSSIFEPSCLRAITVDHGIRSKEESGGDALFVKDLCGKLGIPCHVEEILHGKIEGLSKESSSSVEAVARSLRYEAFDSFIKKENLLALCLAHNQNDQCETLLMRFLQGSGTEGMGGIERVRGKFIRPLLEIPRSEIEDYLRQKNQSWRTDSTNFDTNYLRNRIRNILVPVLNENFSGWQNAVLSGAKKAASDEDFLRSAAKSFCAFGTAHSQQGSAQVKKCPVQLPEAPTQLPGILKIERNFFFGLHPSLQRRVFFDFLNKIGWGGRFPFRIFEGIASWGKVKSQKISFENVTVSLDSENLLLEVIDVKSPAEDDSSIESGFCFFLKKIGDKADIENLLAASENLSEKQGLSESEKSSDCKNCLLSFVSKTSDSQKISFPARLPLLVRSPLPGDEIKTSDGNLKSLPEIFTDWKIPKNQRDKILVVEELSFCSENSLKAALGFHLGFKNWIVE